MTPVLFDGANCVFGPPGDLEESQCHSIPAYRGAVERGSVEGSLIVVVAWLPTAEDLERLNAGGPLFISMIGGLAPHFPTTTLQEAKNPA